MDPRAVYSTESTGAAGIPGSPLISTMKLILIGLNSVSKLQNHSIFKASFDVVLCKFTNYQD